MTRRMPIRIRPFAFLCSALLLACGNQAPPQAQEPQPLAIVSSSSAPNPAPVASAKDEWIDETPRIKSTELLEDVAIIRQAYEAMHPGLYRYNTKEQMESHFRALENDFQKDKTLEEAYLSISIFLAKIKCGHTYANFYNQRKDVVDEIFKRPDRLPFYFRWLSKRMFITKNFSDQAALGPGTEVLSIDGVKVAEILERLLPITRADGSNDAKRVSLLEVQGTDEWQTFDIFFSLMYPVTKMTRTLEIRDFKTQQVSTLEVNSFSHKERFAPIAADRARERGDGPVWTLSFPEKDLAVLKMRTFALYNSKWDWKGYLEQSFAELLRRKVKHLVLDIRGNEGGLDVGNVLVDHLGGKTATRVTYQRLVRYRKAPANLDAYLDTWDPSFKDWGADAVEYKDGFFQLKSDPDPKSSAPKSVFRGRTFVLIDAVNSSAAFQFAQMAKDNKLATLLGAPTGGNQRGINGGAFFFLRLPHSKIEVDLPLIGRFPRKEMPDAGITPDVLVEPTVDDIARGTDAEMEAVKKLVRP
jgi:Peptidase family S41